MKSKKLFIIILFSLVLIPTVAFALNFEYGEEILSSETINDDYYGAGGIVQMESDVNGDLILAGGRIAINSIVSQDLMSAGGDITVRGEIRDDARLAGGNININALIKDDLIVAGGNVELGDSGFVGSDLTIAGGNIIISGPINGNMKGSGGNVYINNLIKGNVELFNVDQLTFGPKGKIMGNLSYRSLNPSKTATRETVGGVIDYEPAKLMIPEKEIAAIAIGILAGFSVFHFLSLLFIGLFLIWIVRFYTTNCVQTGYQKPLKSFGLGFLILILAPIAAFLSLITGIGITLSFIIILSWLLVLIFGKLIAIMMIGMKLVRVKDSSGFLRVYGAFILGALIYVILGLIPMIGWAFKFLLLLLGIGALSLYEMKLFKQLRKDKKV